MGWEEGEAEAEVGRGKDGEGFDEDVGRGLIAGEVGVELVAVIASCQLDCPRDPVIWNIVGDVVRSDRANNDRFTPAWVQAGAVR